MYGVCGAVRFEVELRALFTRRPQTHASTRPAGVRAKRGRKPVQ